MVRVIRGQSDWQEALQTNTNKLIVVDFTAVWCGPCKMMKPIFEQLSRTYPNVLFLSVDEGENSDLIHERGVTAFPTFHFILNKEKVDEVVGADQQLLRNKIDFWEKKVFNPFKGTGNTLGKKIDLSEETKNNKEFDEDEQLKLAIAMSQQKEVNEEKKEEKEDMEKQKREFIDQLVEMGFSEIRCLKALKATNSMNLESCISWMTDHDTDLTLDDPNETISVENELTNEEKEIKEKKLRDLLAAKREERIRKEKEDAIANEIQRREMGKQQLSQRDEILAMQKKIEYERRKKEKDDEKKERERLRAEIAKDKAERLARGGTLTGISSNKVTEVKEEKQQETNEQKNRMHLSLEKLLKAKSGKEGLIAMKTLLVYLTNVLEHPQEQKFRIINLENPAFKRKIVNVSGGIGILASVGFQYKQNLLVLEDEKLDLEFIEYAKRILTSSVQNWE